MNLQISQKSRLLLGSLSVAVILLLAVSRGAAAGHTQAQSLAILQAARDAVKGLNYFYQDQGRYPSLYEFSDSSAMLNYFNIFPWPEFSSTACDESFVYKRLNSGNAQLNFCLPQGSGGYQIGWNTLTLNGGGSSEQ